MLHAHENNIFIASSKNNKSYVSWYHKNYIKDVNPWNSFILIVSRKKSCMFTESSETIIFLTKKFSV